MWIIAFVNMETGENSVLIENSSNGLMNNNSIQLNGSPTADETFVTSTNSAIHKDIGFGESFESQNNTDKQKPNVFELIGGNKNCDKETSDCNKKIVLNNNDLAIGFVDDDYDDDNGGDDGTNGEIEGDTSTFNHCNSDEAPKGHDNIG